MPHLACDATSTRQDGQALQDKYGQFRVECPPQTESEFMVNIGDAAPAFDLPTNGGNNLAVPTGKPLILYFYPKDDTKGCTTQAIDFTASLEAFDQLGIDVVGVSPDSVKRHDRFVDKYDLAITLVSDEEKIALNAYGVWVEKSMYGRTYMGVERSTFLISGKGEILEIWRKVRAKGHVEKVLEAAHQHFDGS